LPNDETALVMDAFLHYSCFPGNHRAEKEDHMGQIEAFYVTDNMKYEESFTVHLKYLSLQGQVCPSYTLPVLITLLIFVKN
jgi:hypothetical protein